MNILEKIESRQGVVAVIGLGYVGLPHAVAFAEAGFRVIGIDINEERIEAINRGESYISDVPSAQVAALTISDASTSSSKLSNQVSGGESQNSTVTNPDILYASRLSATNDYNVLTEVDVAIICVPTPLGKTKDPDLSYILAVTDKLANCLHRDMLIILESTTYPGTTVELMLPYLETGINRFGVDGTDNGKHRSTSPSNGYNRRQEVGKDFYLAFSPERIDPGRTDFTVRNTPKVIGGVTPRCTEIAQALYACIIDQVIPVSSPKVAEMVKLLENTFRAVNIALVNEMAIICNKLEIDVWEVIEAAKTKPYGFTAFYPGPGVGGHCIPIDPLYLAWKLKKLNYDARLIQLATDINLDMPHYVLGKITDALNEVGKVLEGAQVLILGVAYKANISDMRESPALDLLYLLQEKGANITYHDPYVPLLNMNGLNMTCVPLDTDALQSADCVVITTAHGSFDWEWVVENSRLVIDTRNATKTVNANAARIIKL